MQCEGERENDLERGKSEVWIGDFPALLLGKTVLCNVWESSTSLRVSRQTSRSRYKIEEEPTAVSMENVNDWMLKYEDRLNV